MKPARPNSDARYAKSAALFSRASKTIPLASQTFSKSYLAYPDGQAPLFLSHGKGSHVWDVDGNEYIDFVNGLLPITLGYDDPDVTAAVVEQLHRGVAFSLATELEVRLAEKLVDLIPCADMVRFGKNGSDATSGAVRLARAYTRREHVAVCGYHGWQDWYIGSTPRNRGVPKAVQELTHVFPYNDLSALETLFAEYRGELACVVMEAMTGTEPSPGYLQGVQDLCRRNDTLFILDEIITGFRFALGGAQELFGIVPDLAAFGKGMGNGFPISAIVGRKEIMREMENIFFSFTAGGEAVSLAAALATLEKFEREDVIGHLWKQGEKIKGAVNRTILELNLSQALTLSGKPPWLLLGFRDNGGATSWQIKTLFIQEMLARGILIQGSHNVSYAHTDADIAALVMAHGEVLGILADAIHNKRIDAYLKCAPMEPVFRVR